MKNSKTRFFAVLITLLFALIFLGYQNYLCREDKKSVESIVMNDMKFHDIHVYQKGFSLILEGHVKSQADLETLISKVNKMKQCRIDFSVSVVQEAK